MKMDEMNQWLENRGYDVDRIYDREAREYIFRISKNGPILIRRFKYPGGDYAYANRMQRDFLVDMDREFCKQYEFGDISEISRCPICGRHPDMTLTVTLDDLLDDDANKISCCGYTFTASSQEECLRKWNQHVESRNKLMNGFMFNTPLSNSIQKEVELIKKVHFNKPVTCVIWTDGTKTLVRAQDGETYDPEKGMALAIAKKFLGNKGNYYNVFDKYLSELEKVDCKECPGTDHGRKTECTWNQDIPCPAKKDVKKPKYEQLMIKDCSIGDEVYIKDGLIKGCRGAIGLCEIVDVGKSDDGLLDFEPGVNILLRTGKVWRVNPDCIVERIKKAPSGKKNKK